MRDDFIPVPAKLPPIEGLDQETVPEKGARTWLWTLVAAVVVLLLVAYVIVLGVMAVYAGLQDRAIASQRQAQEHYGRGLAYMETDEYELAIGEFDLALLHDSGLHDARTQLQKAKELVRSQTQPTSETRQDAALLLYNQAVAHYENGNLGHAVVILDELRGLDVEYQRENVELMLTTSHYQLGLVAVAEDRLDDAAAHFESVLALTPDGEKAQEQLNLIHLYSAALNNWERDWAAAIQSLKGLYALAPDYKDVEARLRDAFLFRAQTYADKDQWCRAAKDYAAAVQMLPLETTVDQRDDAEIRCQAAAEEPTPAPTAQVAAKPTQIAKATATPANETSAMAAAATPEATEAPSSTAGRGRIAFTSYDAGRQRYGIYVVSLAQGDAKLLRDNSSHPAFAPDGKRLAFRNLEPTHLGLGIVGLSSNEIHELTAYGEDSTPAWTSSADQIIFASNKHGDRLWRLYVISPAELRGEGEMWAFGEMPDWSPDGARVAYHGCDERGDNCGLWIIKAGGFDPARLTTDPSDTAPAWSADGKQIAFTSARSGHWDLYLVEVSTGQITRQTDSSAADVAPTWSPDGKQLAFLSSREGTWAVFVLTIESGQVQKIIATGDAYPDPVHEQLSWTP